MKGFLKMKGANRHPLCRADTALKMKGANRHPSTNTKTKLDLTNVTQIFTNPHRYECKVKQKISYSNGFSIFFAFSMDIFYIRHVFWAKKLSKMVIAAIASTTGTARGSTHGSCLPFAVNVVTFPSRSTVFCSRSRVATGLKATRK